MQNICSLNQYEKNTHDHKFDLYINSIFCILFLNEWSFNLWQIKEPLFSNNPCWIQSIYIWTSCGVVGLNLATQVQWQKCQKVTQPICLKCKGCDRLWTKVIQRQTIVGLGSPKCFCWMMHLLCVKGERMNILSFDVDDDNYFSLMALFPSVSEKVKLLKEPLLWVHEPLGACYYLSMLIFLCTNRFDKWQKPCWTFIV